MQFFNSMITVLSKGMSGMGCGIGLWGLFNLFEGYGGENPAAKTQGAKQLFAGFVIVLIAQTVVPGLATIFG